MTVVVVVVVVVVENKTHSDSFMMASLSSMIGMNKVMQFNTVKVRKLVILNQLSQHRFDMNEHFSPSTNRFSPAE